MGVVSTGGNTYFGVGGMPMVLKVAKGFIGEGRLLAKVFIGEVVYWRRALPFALICRPFRACGCYLFFEP